MPGAVGGLEEFERAFEVVEQSVVEQRAEGTKGEARGGGIGGIGLHKQFGTVAAQEITREVFRDIDDELDAALREQIVALFFRGDLAGEIEIRAVLQRIEHRAPLGAMIGEQHRGRQMARVGVDREAEERELDERNAEHHGEGQPVAPHLREFFHHDADEAREGEFWTPVHDAEVVRSPVHEVNEDILEAGRDFGPRIRFAAKGGDRPFERGWVITADVQGRRQTPRPAGCRVDGGVPPRWRGDRGRSPTTS